MNKKAAVKKKKQPETWDSMTSSMMGQLVLPMLLGIEATRKGLYEDFSRRLSTQVYNIWTWYENWYVASKSSVQGVLGPNLPDASGNPGTDKPVDVLAGYHQLLGLWVKK